MKKTLIVLALPLMLLSANAFALSWVQETGIPTVCSTKPAHGHASTPVHLSLSDYLLHLLGFGPSSAPRR
jgi:hypothetical protein